MRACNPTGPKAGGVFACTGERQQNMVTALGHPVVFFRISFDRAAGKTQLFFSVA